MSANPSAGALSYVNLFCRDIDKVFEFFRDLFGVEEIKESRSPIFRGALTGGASVGFSAYDAYPLLGLAPPTGETGDLSMITFEVADRATVDRLADKAVASGAILVKSPSETYYGWYQAVLRSPEGHVFRINRSG